VKQKFRKLDVIAVFMLIQDLSRNKQFKFDKTFPQKLASHILDDREANATGKSTSGHAIATYYFGWRSKLPEELGVRLDPIRAFSEEQKAEMLKRDGPTCQMCGEDLTLDDAEGDHHPTPWRAAGRTLIENGRLVHKACHIRGRPAATADLIDLTDLAVESFGNGGVQR
jgi:hypothetical protein